MTAATAQAVQSEIVQPPNLGETISRMLEIRAEKARLADLEKVLNEEWRLHEANLIRLLDEQGATKVSSGVATASVTTEIVPMVDDWERFYDYIYNERAFHLLQRRPSSAAYRELQQAGTDIPGVTPFSKRSISLRAK